MNIGVEEGEARDPPLEVTRADLKIWDFFWEHIILLKIFCFEHSDRFFSPPQTVLLSYGHGYILTSKKFPMKAPRPHAR